MTSAADEIANLRAALDDIRLHCAHEIKHETDEAAAANSNALIKLLHTMAVRGLRTPRASKVLTVGEIMDDSDMTGRS